LSANNFKIVFRILFIIDYYYIKIKIDYTYRVESHFNNIRYIFYSLFVKNKQTVNRYNVCNYTRTFKATALIHSYIEFLVKIIFKLFISRFMGTYYYYYTADVNLNIIFWNVKLLSFNVYYFKSHTEFFRVISEIREPVSIHTFIFALGKPITQLIYYTYNIFLYSIYY